MKRGIIIGLGVFALLIAAALVFAFTFNLSALETPGETETWLATKAKRWLVARAARAEPPPPAPEWSHETLSDGKMYYEMSCGSCHGPDGHEPTKLGLSLYPPSPGLGSPPIQEYTDAELFWIIKHGVRHSGMPGFARIHSDDDIWRIVHYVRSLREGQM